jgi:hypothetical protein
LERHLAAALSTAYETGEGPLTLYVTPRAPPAFRPALLEEPRTAPTAPSSKRTASSIQSAFRRQVLPRFALAMPFSRGSPPPSPRLCHRGAAPGAFSPLHGSRPERLDPSRLERLFTSGGWGPDAACQLLQPPRSASTTSGSPEPRTPRLGSPRCAALPATPPCEGETSHGWLRRASRDSTGQGSAWRARKPSTRDTSRRDRSRPELHPNPIGPDTSCRVTRW